MGGYGLPGPCDGPLKSSLFQQSLVQNGPDIPVLKQLENKQLQNLVHVKRTIHDFRLLNNISFRNYSEQSRELLFAHSKLVTSFSTPCVQRIPTQQKRDVRKSEMGEREVRTNCTRL